MTNKEAVEKFENANSIVINKMFWLAGGLESSDLKEMVEDDMSGKDWERAFPDMEVKHIDEYINSSDAMQLFCDYNKFGFLAQLHYPRHYGFRYNDKGEVSSCAVSGGIYTIEYAYGETIEELMKVIEKIAEENYQDDIKSDKKKAKKKIDTK